MIQLDSFSRDGFIVVPNFIGTDLCGLIVEDLEAGLIQEESCLAKSGVSDRQDKGMLHNCFLYSDRMMDILNHDPLLYFTDHLLCRNAIVYAYQSSSAPPHSSNYGRRIHVDSPRFVPNYITNIGFILALTDFTEENGATEILPGSHISSIQPSADYFDEHKISLCCKAGDAIFFNARLWHRTGINTTSAWRHALTINFCRPFMRSRFDFPRLATSSGRVPEVGSQASKYLGWNVRVPESLEQFYLPESERLYQPNQEL